MVVPFGVAMALVFMVPVGIVTAVTGVQPTLNVIAEFIGRYSFDVPIEMACVRRD